MQQVTNVELQSIRHLIGAEMLAANKARVFAGQVNDPQLKSFLERKARVAEQNVQRLEQFITG